MSASKYGSFLTIILIILIIVILTGSGLLLYNYVIKPNRDGKQKIEAIEEFNRGFESNEQQNDNEDQEENKQLEVEATNNSNNGGNKQIVQSKTYFKGYVMLGYITIAKTNVKEPILDSVTPETLDTGVAVLYPSSPKINQPGNTVIVGHNYRNGTFFSNNNKLDRGDKIQIKDATGQELVYTIYDKFKAAENDTSFYSRDTNGAIEITLSTCTDDSKERIIILAKVEQ